MEFTINVGNTQRIAGKVSGQAKSMSTVIASMERISRSCPLSGSSRQMVLKSLNETKAEIAMERQAISALGNSLTEIVSLYKNSENKISGKTSENSLTNSEDKKNNITWKWSDSWKIIGSIGTIGAGTAAIGSLITGGWNAKNVVSSVKYLTKAIGSGATAISKKGVSANWWEYLIGKNSGLSGIDSSSLKNGFLSSLKKQFVSDLNFGNAQSVADNVKIATKWGGYLLTGAARWIENYKDYKAGNISLDRVIGQTAIETAVDIGVGAVVTAGVTALAGALVTAGVTFAGSAVLIGAAGVGVTWAANSICKAITNGKDIGEVVADGIYDHLMPAISKGVGKAKQVVGNIKNAISAPWSRKYSFA